MSFKEYADNDLRENLFQGRHIKIAEGLIQIDVRTCKIKKAATTTLDNAAKIAASYIYAAINIGQREYNGIPVWVNTIQFRDEKTMTAPAVTIVDDQLNIARPPFAGDMDFWRAFTKYWYQNVLVSKSKALECMQKTRTEQEQCNHTKAHIKDLPLMDRL
jgi:hypothetical protein